jgi:hypothetical protein
LKIKRRRADWWNKKKFIGWFGCERLLTKWMRDWDEVDKDADDKIRFCVCSWVFPNSTILLRYECQLRGQSSRISGEHTCSTNVVKIEKELHHTF